MGDMKSRQSTDKMNSTGAGLNGTGDATGARDMRAGKMDFDQSAKERADSTKNDKVK